MNLILVLDCIHLESINNEDLRKTRLLAELLLLTAKRLKEEVRKVQDEASSKGKDITTEDTVAAAVLNLHSRGMRSVQMATDGHMQNATKGFWGNVEEKRCLKEVKAG